MSEVAKVQRRAQKALRGIGTHVRVDNGPSVTVTGNLRIKAGKLPPAEPMEDVYEGLRRICTGWTPLRVSMKVYYGRREVSTRSYGMPSMCGGQHYQWRPYPDSDGGYATAHVPQHVVLPKFTEMGLQVHDASGMPRTFGSALQKYYKHFHAAETFESARLGDLVLMAQQFANKLSSAGPRYRSRTACMREECAARFSPTREVIGPVSYLMYSRPPLSPKMTPEEAGDAMAEWVYRKSAPNTSYAIMSGNLYNSRTTPLYWAIKRGFLKLPMPHKVLVGTNVNHGHHGIFMIAMDLRGNR